MRAAYPLVVTGRLNADRGSGNNPQPDRRHPGEVLDTMRRSTQGVLQLAQSLNDFAAKQSIRAVDENGGIVKLADGSGDQPVSDVYLRGQFPPPGKASSRWIGDTPLDHYQNRLNDFSQALDRLEQAFSAIGKVAGEDGRPIVETRGADPRLCGAWRTVLGHIDDELNIWARLFRRMFGTASDQFAIPDSDGSQDEEVDLPEDESDLEGGNP